MPFRISRLSWCTSVAVIALAAPARSLLAQSTPAMAPRSLTPYLVALSVSNLDSAYAWYRTLLGFDDLRRPYDLAPGFRIGFLIRGDFRLELIESANSRPRAAALPDTTNDVSLQGLTKLGFQVPDVDGVAVLLRGRGVRVVFGPASDSSFKVRHLIVADPDGNLVQFFQPLSDE